MIQTLLLPLAMLGLAVQPEPADRAGAPQAAPAEAAQPELIDLTPEFAAAWEKTADLPEGERVAAFKAHFEPLLPGLFRSRYFDPLIRRSLESYPADKAGIAAVSRSFAPALAPAMRRFQEVFGPQPPSPVYLVHSTGEFDGSVRRIAGKDALIFGADRLARRLGPAGDLNVQPLLHHEFFHAHHNRNFTGCWDRLWCDVWREGLATYVASALNPDASERDLGIEELRRALEPDPAAAVCLVLQKLDTGEPNERRDFTSLNYTVPGMPPRFGYYVGFLAAQALGASHTLPQLARLTPAEVRPLLEQSLRAMATCQPRQL